MINHNIHTYVIGSGPSGVACAYMLLSQGAKVTMLDFGNKRFHSESLNFDSYLTNRNRDALIRMKDLRWDKNKEANILNLNADEISDYFPLIRASCELWIKNRRDEGMKWRLGMTGVMRNRQRQGFEGR